MTSISGAGRKRRAASPSRADGRRAPCRVSSNLAHEIGPPKSKGYGPDDDILTSGNSPPSAAGTRL